MSSALVSRVRRRLKQFHEIAGWVFNQNLPATRSSDDVIAKHNSRALQDVNIVLEIAALNDNSVPPTRFRSPAVGHRLRSASRPLGGTQHQLHVFSREDRKVGARLSGGSKPQPLAVKRNCSVDVVHNVANHKRVQLHNKNSFTEGFRLMSLRKIALLLVMMSVVALGTFFVLLTHPPPDTIGRALLHLYYKSPTMAHLALPSGWRARYGI